MSIFKDCDIRGIYPGELSAQQAFLIGRAAASYAPGKSFAVGGDVRLSTPELKKAVIDGLLSSGADVKDLGILPTPAFYFARSEYGADAGIMVTASHNPPAYNGMKLIFGALPVTPGDISRLKDIVNSESFSFGAGRLTAVPDALDRYERHLLLLAPKSRLRVVLDCGDGTTSLIAPRLFKKAGCDVVELFCGVDGSFRRRDPNPAVYSNLTELQRTVLKSGAALGMAFDGDGDRVVFCDERGMIIESERALVLMIRRYLANSPAPVVYDQKSSSVVARQTALLGGKPVMERSGHAFIKRTFLKENAALAGEISGHFFFRELGGDDGMYAGLVMCAITACNPPLSALVESVPKTVITPDIRLKVPYSQQEDVLDRVRRLADRQNLSELDGVRISFENGWLLVRKSVTEQAMTVRIEAENEAALQSIRAKLAAAAPELKF